MARLPQQMPTALHWQPWQRPNHIMGTVSEDAVRLGMRRMEEKAGLHWISTQILSCISPMLVLPWSLDIDVTVKPL